MSLVVGKHHAVGLVLVFDEEILISVMNDWFDLDEPANVAEWVPVEKTNIVSLDI